MPPRAASRYCVGHGDAPREVRGEHAPGRVGAPARPPALPPALLAPTGQGPGVRRPPTRPRRGQRRDRGARAHAERRERVEALVALAGGADAGTPRKSPKTPARRGRNLLRAVRNLLGGRVRSPSGGFRGGARRRRGARGGTRRRWPPRGLGTPAAPVARRRRGVRGGVRKAFMAAFSSFWNSRTDSSAVSLRRRRGGREVACALRAAAAETQRAASCSRPRGWSDAGA